ncbi:MAG: hypothetical protein AB1563_00565 [Bacillota bacterium]
MSISGFRDVADVSREVIDALRLVDPLPEGQAEWRIYDVAMMNRIWEAHDKGASLEVVLDSNGQPIGVKADGVLILPEASSS